jgi:hypothetical protein
MCDRERSRLMDRDLLAGLSESGRRAARPYVGADSWTHVGPTVGHIHGRADAGQLSFYREDRERSSIDHAAADATRTSRYVPGDRRMVPCAALLLTSMKPLIAKICIGRRSTFHSSTLGERATIVPSDRFPEPAKRRSRRPPGEGDRCWVEIPAEAPCLVAAARSGGTALGFAARAAEVRTSAFRGPAAEVDLRAEASTDALGLLEDELPPQPAAGVITSRATEITATPLESPI